MEKDIFYQLHRVENELGLIYFSHGFVEYSGQYTSVVSELNNKGYSVVRYDLRGHGRSPKELKEANDFINDLLFVRNEVLKIYQPQLEIGMGFSLGAIASLLLASSADNYFDQLILLGAGLSVRHEFDGMDDAKEISIVEFMAMIDAKADEGIDALLKMDHPMVLQSISGAYLKRAMVDGPRQIMEGLGNMKIPILLIHGTQDPMIPIDGALSLFNQIQSSDRSFISIHKGKHDVLRVKKRDIAYAYIYNWLGNRSKIRKTS